MANLSKLKRRNTLGAPPPLDEASQNLNAPEVAPAVAPPAPQLRAAAPTLDIQTGDGRLRATDGQGRLDGRTLRKSGRTLQFATRVTWEFDDRLRQIAQRDRLKLVEVLERGLDAYEAARKK
jgi:hypothetical protein